MTALTAGLGFRPAHLAQALAARRAGLGFEVHAENYMADGGPRPRLLDALFTEAFAERGGREAALSRLSEVVLIHLLRHALACGLVQSGVVAGLAGWRLSLAQRLLAQGRQVKSIADEVGYGSPNALTRAFTQRLGHTPTEWLARRAGSGA